MCSPLCHVFGEQVVVIEDVFLLDIHEFAYGYWFGNDVGHVGNLCRLLMKF